MSSLNRCLAVIVLCLLSGCDRKHPAEGPQPLPSFPAATLYKDARVQLQSNGWVPATIPDSVPCAPGDSRCQGFPETQACGPDGVVSACKFMWKKGETTIEVETTGDAPQAIYNIVCQANCLSNPTASTTPLPAPPEPAPQTTPPPVEPPGTKEISDGCVALNSQSTLSTGPLSYPQTQFHFVSAEITATSVDQSSNTAVVKATCHLTYIGPSGFHLERQTMGVPGFDRWVDTGKVWSTGEAADFAVVFHLRRFDTGWSVDGND
jgi:hypothetical protein